MVISQPAILTYFASLLIIFFSCVVFFRNTTLWQSGRWRRHLLWSVLANTVLFGSIAVYFYSQYGFITDDLFYFTECLNYHGNIFTCKTADELMCAIAHPLRAYFHLDLPACHVLFGTFGFLGSLIFVQVLMARMDFRQVSLRRRNIIAFWTLVCFPNFVAWGRFFGKDSTMFFLTAVMVYNAYRVVSGRKFKPVNIILIASTFAVMFRIRPHLFAVMMTGFSLALLVKAYTARMPDVGVRGMYQVVMPLVFLAVSLFIGAGVIRSVSRQNEVSVQAVQSSFVTASKMGAYGGSSTGLAEKMSDDPTVIFKPTQVALNVIFLLFAPFPWQIRGGADIMALASNLIFFFLLYLFRRTITGKDLFQKYLLINIALLVVILSFMSGNVGLILREKTILLPFVFLFIFYNPKNKLAPAPRSSAKAG